MSIRSNTPSIITESPTFIGIDYHKRYRFYKAIDAAGADLGKGRIEHHSPRHKMPCNHCIYSIGF